MLDLLLLVILHLFVVDQERGLENLSNIIARQKNIAHAIHSEVDLHNGKTYFIK